MAAIDMRQQHVGAEADQAADRIRLPLQNGAIEFAGGDVAGLCRSERTFAEAQRRRFALRRGEVLAGDRPGGRNRKQHVAAGSVEAAGQSVEQRHGACGLRRVGVLLVAAPGVVGNRAGFPDQARGLFDLSSWDPADRLDLLGRIVPTQLRVELEGGMADHVAVACGDAIFALEREIRAVAIVWHWRVVCGVPGDVAASLPARREITFGQHAAVVGTHQHRTVAPIADELAIVPAALDHQIGDAEGERAIGARPHTKPEIGLVAETDMPRIDHDEAHAALQRLDHGGGVREARETWIVSPQDQAAGVGDVRHAAARTGGDARNPIRVAGRPRTTPAAYVQTADYVRRAEGVHQAPDVRRRFADRRGGRRRQAETDAFWPLLRRDPPHRRGGHFQCLVPGDALPAGIRIAFRTGAAERARQSLLVVDKLGRGAALGAECLAGRMRGIRLQPDEAAMFDYRDRAASGGAKRTVAVDTLLARNIGHGRRAPDRRAQFAPSLHETRMWTATSAAVPQV